MKMMPPRIAIPVPHSGDPEYAERSLPQYERAVELAGGAPIRIPLDRPPAEIMKIIERCDAVLLPGSRADVDPSKYDAPRHVNTAEADPKRDTVDELLLQDAYNMRKPILGICYGLQILNVYRTGTLIQDLAEFLPPEKQKVNHAAGRNVPEALEGTSPDHFVLAVQWHPERSVDQDEPSRAIFRALVEAARTRHRELVGEFEAS